MYELIILLIVILVEFTYPDFFLMQFIVTICGSLMAQIIYMNYLKTDAN
jgi:hypothetical protein